SVPRDWENPNGWVKTCLDDVATRAWSVVVVHDLPTGAMHRLPELLDGLDAMGAHVVQEFPDECVPLRRGVRTSTFACLPFGTVPPEGHPLRCASPGRLGGRGGGRQSGGADLLVRLVEEQLLAPLLLFVTQLALAPFLVELAPSLHRRTGADLVDPALQV